MPDTSAGTRVENMVEDTAAAAADVLYMVSDPGGTPVPRKIEVRNILPRRYLQVTLFAAGASVDTATSTTFVEIPDEMDTYFLAEASALHITAGTDTTATTIPTNVQVFNTTASVYMFSTAATTSLTIAAAGTVDSSYTIDTTTGNHIVAAGEVLRFDVERVPDSTAPVGLIVTLGFDF